MRRLRLCRRKKVTSLFLWLRRWLSSSVLRRRLAIVMLVSPIPLAILADKLTGLHLPETVGPVAAVGEASKLSLPIFTTDDKNLTLLQTNWASQINPVLAQPMNSGVTLKNVSLGTGSNTINHRLARRLQGWTIIRQRAAAVIYDTQDSNQMQDKTLVLVSSAPVVVDLLVF